MKIRIDLKLVRGEKNNFQSGNGELLTFILKCCCAPRIFT